MFAQLIHIFDARTFSTLFRKNPFSNKYLLAAVIGSAAASVAMVYLPVGNFVFGTVPLTFKHFVMVLCMASLPTFLLSAAKEVFRIRWI